MDATDTNRAGIPISPDCAAAADFHLGYRRWLDGLRGWAVLMVLGTHLQILRGGSLGVDIFFVLSGFLITTLLVEEWQRRGSISLKHFYLRRSLRLMPALYCVLLIFGVDSWLRLPVAEAIEHSWEILIAGGYVTNLPMIHGIGTQALSHTWSLSVEEQFYLLWPALLYLMLALRLPRRRIVLLVCAGVLASVALKITLYHMYRSPSPLKNYIVHRMYMGLDTRADSLLVGCLAGLAATWNLLPTSDRFIRWTGVGAVVSAVGLAFLAGFTTETQTVYFHGLFTVVALMVATIIVRLLAAPSRLGTLLLESTPIVGIGRISYGVYLYHVLVMYWLGAHEVGWSHPGMLLAVVVLTFAAALASYFCIERPCLRLKDRLGHRRADAPARQALAETQSDGGAAPRQAAA